MSKSENDSPVGTPSVQLQLESLFGKRVEVVKADSNRVDPGAEASDLARRALIQGRFIDATFNALSWVGGSAFTMSLCLHSGFLGMFWAPLGVVCLIGVGAIAYGLFYLPDARIPVLMKVAFVLIGVILGGRPL